MENEGELPPPFDMIGQIPKCMSIKDAIMQGIKFHSQSDEGISVWPILTLIG